MARHEQNIIARGQMRKQTAILNHVSDSAAKLQNIFGSDRRAVEFDRASVGHEQSNGQAKQCRFAAPAGTDQHGGFMFLCRKVDRSRRSNLVELFADTDKFNERAHFLSGVVAASLCEAPLKYPARSRGRRLQLHAEIKKAKQLRIVRPETLKR